MVTNLLRMILAVLISMGSLALPSVAASKAEKKAQNSSAKKQKKHKKSASQTKTTKPKAVAKPAGKESAKTSASKKTQTKAPKTAATTAKPQKSLAAKAPVKDAVTETDDELPSEPLPESGDSSSALLYSFLSFLVVGGGGIWLYLRRKGQTSPAIGLGDTPPPSMHQDEVFGSNLASLDLADSQSDVDLSKPHRKTSA